MDNDVQDNTSTTIYNLKHAFDLFQMCRRTDVLTNDDSQTDSQLVARHRHSYSRRHCLQSAPIFNVEQHMLQ